MGTTDPRTLGDQPAVPFSQITESYHQAHAQYRAEKIAEAMYVCVRGDDYGRATIHDSMQDARSAAQSKNTWLRAGGEG
jgi:hypothetical protein